MLRFFRLSPKEIGKKLRFEYIQYDAQTGEISMYCRVLEVSVLGYKKYLESLRKTYKYADLLVNIEAVLEEDEYNQTYGKQRMYEKLQLDYECPFCYNTVAKVMRENGLLQGRNHSKGLTKADKDAQKSDNLIKRDFKANAPLAKIVTDITEFSALDGKLYVSGIFDCFDNTCLGLSMADNMKTELVIDSYIQAEIHYSLKGTISHSDRESQYTREKFKDMLRDFGIIQSMNSAGGRCHDNAKCESMWARAKEEINDLYNVSKITCAQLTSIIYDYFLDYWNYRRICSAIGGMPPMLKRGAYYEEINDLVA